MVRAFCLVDSESNDLIGAYDSEAEALEVVADTARRYGPHSEAAATLALVRDDQPGAPIASGPALVRRALARWPPDRPCAAG